jgi:hypothetical protein
MEIIRCEHDGEPLLAISLDGTVYLWKCEHHQWHLENDGKFNRNGVGILRMIDKV